MENTWIRQQRGGRIQDHLHLRGEYGYEESTHRPTLGSSPLTWRILCGISCPAFCIQDHLHLRGEYSC